MSETNTVENREEEATVSDAVEPEVDATEVGEEVVDKTFSQEEVDKIVANRVAREERKVNDFAESAKKWQEAAAGLSEKLKELETSMAEAAIKISALELDKVKFAVAAEANVDPSLLDALRWSNEEELRSALETLKTSFKNTPKADIGFTGKNYSNDDSIVKYARNVMKKYE